MCKKKKMIAFKKKILPVCIRRFIRGKCVEELSTCGWISSTHTKVWVGNIEKERERERDILSCRVKTSVRCKSSRQLLSSFILKWREIKDSWVLRTKPWKSERFLTLIRRNAPRKKMCVHRRKKNLFNRDWFLPRPPSLLPSWRWWIRSRCHPAKLTGRSDKKGNLLFHH